MTILETEIKEQPEVIARFINTQKPVIKRIASELKEEFFSYVLIAARGSSDNAGRYGQYVLGSFNGFPVASSSPSLHTLYEAPPRYNDSLVIAISQSGRSPDIVRVVDAAKQQKRPTIVITNDPNSLAAKSAKWVIDLSAGKERAVAATKTYTTSLLALAMLSCALSSDEERFSALSELPNQIAATIDGLRGIETAINRYAFAERSAVIARGFNYCTAFEIALKVKELTRVVAEPYSSADFLHGPISILEKGFPIIIVAPSGKTFTDLATFTETVRSRGAETIIISDDNELLSSARLPLPIASGVPEWLSPIVSVIPGQLFGFYLALAKGLNADNPIGLCKVTETY